MDNLNIFVVRNKELSNILLEIKPFKNGEILFFENLLSILDSSLLNTKDNIFIITAYYDEKNFIKNLNKINKPNIIIVNQAKIKNLKNDKIFNSEYLSIPFKVNELISKITICFSKYSFEEKSVINILEYILDVNKREIIKDNKKLKLTEKEVDFLLYLKDNREPISREKILNNVWNYSFKTETHTVETHIHRLRKKFLDTFGEENIIKNNKKGYSL